MRISKEVVYTLVSKIPEGKVTTYGEIARAIGMPNSSRAIGNILNKNPRPLIIPCHRVVRSNGDIGGYVFGSDVKRKILEREGVKIDNSGKIIDFDNTLFTF